MGRNRIAHPLISLTSKYQQRMRKLSCKIFNDFFIPELTRKDLEYGDHHEPVRQFITKVHRDLRVYERCQERPIDVDETRNWKYYPPHPQVLALSESLRAYGLFRDEHQDFVDEKIVQATQKGNLRVRDYSKFQKKSK